MVNQKALEIINEVEKVVRGKQQCIRTALSAILAGGHILIEDVPGVGKTTLAMAFGKVMDLENRRLQFTPDVLPADIVGFSMYDRQSGQFVYCPGPVMCNLFLADEINRTSPKTQSALLEVMEEGSVTVDGVTREVPKPFIVMATQNPKGSAGTQLLPESQLDRFMICMSMGYPDAEHEVEIARGKSMRDGMGEIQRKVTTGELLKLTEAVEAVFVHENVYRYIVRLVTATRENGYIELGASPRGTIALTKMARSEAFLNGREYVLPEDVRNVFSNVIRHRITLNAKARVSHITAETVLSSIVRDVQSPTVQREMKGYHA